MTKLKTCLFFLFQILSFLHAQESWVKGVLVDQTGGIVSKVQITTSINDRVLYSDFSGFFKLNFSETTDLGKTIITFQKYGYETQNVPIDFSKTSQIDLGIWKLFQASTVEEEIPLAEFSEELFNNLREDELSSNPLLSSQRTVLLEAMAFQFRSSFFSARGLSSASQNLWMNGIKMNDFERGRPQWSQWGGLNDIINKSQAINYGLVSAFNMDSGPLGSVSIDFTPSTFRKKVKLSYAMSNSNYQHRFYTVYHSGVIQNKWAFSALGTHRWGEEGYMNGTEFNGTSVLFSGEHLWNKRSQSILTFFYTPSLRGRSAPLTEEVYDLKGRKYNPYWGWDKGKKRNARMRRTQIPAFHFRHLYNTEKWKNQWNVLYQFGEIANSRILYNGSQLANGYWSGGGRNPDPVYYQNLPSFYLQQRGEEDFASAYRAQLKLENDGQLNWNSLRNANQLVAESHTPYLLYDDIKTIKRWSFSYLTERKFETSALNIYGNYTINSAAFYAQPIDFLGGKTYWDIDPFALNFEAAQNDLLQPNRKIEERIPFQYHYEIETQDILLGLQLKKKWPSLNLHLEGNINPRQYQRIGKFKSGSFPENSHGKGSVLSFLGASLKANFQWDISARMHLFLQGGYFLQPPPFSKLYVNPRVNHAIVNSSLLEKVQAVSAKFIWQTHAFDFRLSPFWMHQNHINRIGFYFAQGIGGDASFFIQEVMQGIALQNSGIESSIKLFINDRYQLKSAFVWGNYLHLNAPNLQLYTLPSEEAKVEGFIDGKKEYGQTQLKGYRQGVGPETALNLTLDYQDPNYWRMSVAVNYFSNAYMQPSPLRRTNSFFQDSAGFLLPNTTPEGTRDVLYQEKFPNYFVLNLTWNKSWRLQKYYVNLFSSIQNMLDTRYKVGGFEQGRNANYTHLLEDQKRSLPLFGNKYWWGRGTTFFTTLSIQF